MIADDPGRCLDLNEAPYIIVSQVLDMAAWQRLYDGLAAHESDPGFVRYRMFGPPGSGQDTGNRISWLFGEDWGWLDERVFTAAKQVNDAHYHRDISGRRESQYTSYSEGQEYGWHTDNGSYSTENRTLSGVLLLKDPEQGGGLEVEEAGIVPLNAGDMAVFPSERVHRAIPVISGIRDTLIYWLRSD